DAAYRRLRAFDVWTPAAAALFTFAIGVVYALLFLVDRRRRETGLMAGQSLAGMTYALYWTGAMQVVGTWDNALVGVCTSLAGLIGALFAHAQLGLGPMRRRWIAAALAVVALGVAVYRPFSMRLAAVLLMSVAVPSCFYVALRAVLAVRQREH